MFSFNVSTGSVEVNYTNSKWYLGNAGATGFYRTYYDKSNYIALLKLLENDHEVHTHTHTHTHNYHSHIQQNSLCVDFLVVGYIVDKLQ